MEALNDTTAVNDHEDNQQREHNRILIINTLKDGFNFIPSENVYNLDSRHAADAGNLFTYYSC